MPARKIVDEQEVIRWFEEGRTYEWMSQQYLERYGIETVPSLWSNFRRRRGLARRIVRDDQLIPWAVREEHRYAYFLQMLRLEARHRAGEPVREADKIRWQNFIARLHEEGLVVHYDPDTERGFFLIPREAGDTDIVRRPLAAMSTTRRHAD
jgi:hypothetical protein